MSVCLSRLPRRHHRRMINVARQYLWRAVDQNGYVIDIQTQRQRDTTAAKEFSRKLPKGMGYMPRVVTDKLKSSGAALRDRLPGIEHRRHRYLNNRIENSLQPTRQRERRRGSSRLGRLNASSPRMFPSCNTFVPEATALGPSNTVGR
jgi:transposase-like protein